jgi:hypothetical protein
MSRVYHVSGPLEMSKCKSRVCHVSGPVQTSIKKKYYTALSDTADMRALAS